MRTPTSFAAHSLLLPKAITEPHNRHLSPAHGPAEIPLRHMLRGRLHRLCQLVSWLYFFQKTGTSIAGTLDKQQRASVHDL